ncbi:MAG: hypothetical protein ACYCPS_01310 [Candidatus Saccharimonadales bacterium]
MENQLDNKIKPQTQPLSTLNNRNIKKIVIGYILATVLVVGSFSGAYFWQHKKVNSLNTQLASLQNKVRSLEKQQDSIAPLTNDQIFKEVSAQLNLSRSSLVYFRIFGQDKVQYSSHSTGNSYAYKISDTWKIAATGVQSVILCSTLNNVPEQYRPPCNDSYSTTSKVNYENSDGTSTNYPISKAVSYIGQ